MMSTAVNHSPPRRLAVVVNVASGGVGPEAPSLVERMLVDRGLDVTLFAPDPGQVERSVREAVDGAPDLLVILAGDGTARLAAELCGPTGPVLAPLPGGTLNMLPRALYGRLSWRDALAATLDHGVERFVCGGRIGGHAFYVAAILGSPALWGQAREALREGRLNTALARTRFALRRLFSGRVYYALDEGPRRMAGALVLISPTVSKAMVSEVALEAAALSVRSARDAFRLAMNGLLSDWRKDPGISTGVCYNGRAWARRSIPATLDGEMIRLPRQVDIEFKPDAFRARVPDPSTLSLVRTAGI